MMPSELEAEGVNQAMTVPDTLTGCRVTAIYALADPDTDEVRYIGKTVGNPHDRIKVHVFQAKRATRPTHKEAWIKGLLAQDRRPVAYTLELVWPGNDWATREMHWINFARKMGYRLTNLTEGGDGLRGYIYDDDLRDKKRQQMLGNQHGRGHKWTPEQRVKMMASRTHEAMSARTRGSKHPRARLTEADVLGIRSRYEAGERQADLAREFQVTDSTIWHVVHRISWRHI